MATVSHRITPEELLRMPEGKDYELVDGELKDRPMSMLSTFVAGEFYRRLAEFVAVGNLGWVFVADAGFRCFPHDESRVRKPDVSFVSKERMSADDIGSGWSRIAPDLVVEVISPNDNVADFEQKLEDYRSAAIPFVWVIHPDARTAWIHRADGTSRHLTENVELVGEGPLDGFRCRLDDLLPRG